MCVWSVTLWKALKCCLLHSLYSNDFKQAVREAARYAPAPAPVRRTLQPSSSPYTPYACGAQRALRHEYSWSTGSGSLWLWLWCRPYKLCSDLNSQPTWPGDFLTLKVVSESSVTWATSVPILVFLGLFVLELSLTYATDVRQTDVRRQTSDKSIT